MLVLGPGKVVLAVDVSPIPGGGDIFSLDVAPGGGFTVVGSEVVELGVVLDASLTEGLGFFSLGFFGEEGFRGFGFFEDFDSDHLAIDFVDVYGFGGKGVKVGKDSLGGVGVVLDTSGPSISGDSEGASGFDTKVVDTLDDSEVAGFTPVGTPRVSDDPELGAVFGGSPTNDGDIVIDIGVVSGVDEDTTSVVKEWASSDTADDGASLVDFVHHVFFTGDWAVFIDMVDVVAFRNPAAFVGETVLALDIIGTVDTVVPTSGLVDRAGFIGDVVVVDVGISSQSITTVATLIGGFTGDQDLGRDVDIGPLSVSHDLDSVGHGGGGGHSPA